MATLAPERDLTQAYDRALQLATGQAALTVTRKVRELGPETFAATWAVIAGDIAETITKGQQAAVAASSWYLAETVRTTTAFAPEIATVAGLVGVAGNGMSVARYVARTPDIVAVRVANGMKTDVAIGMAQRSLTALAATEPYRVARAAVAQTATTDTNFVGWRRVPEAGACSFCLTLASRGAAYTSKASAELTSKALRYHRNCRCRSEPLTSERAAATNAAAAQAYADLERPIFYRTGTRSDSRPAGTGSTTRQRASQDFYQRAPLYRPGARTPERLANVQLQMQQLEDRIADMTARRATGDTSVAPALKWSTDRLAELRAELAQLT